MTAPATPELRLLSFLCGECAPCAHQLPIVQRLGASLGIPMTQVDLMEDPDTALANNVLAHPALILRDERDRVRVVGVRSLRYLTNRIVSNIGLDETAATELLRRALDTDGEVLDRKARRVIRTAADRVSVLAQIPIFSALAKRDLKAVNKLVDEVMYPADTLIFNQGDEGRSMLMIVDGVAVVKRNKRFVTRVGPGDVVGEMAIIDGEERSATVVTDTDVSALVLERSDFSHLIRTIPGLAPAVMATLSTRLRDADRKLYG